MIDVNYFIPESFGENCRWQSFFYWEHLIDFSKDALVVNPIFVRLCLQVFES